MTSGQHPDRDLVAEYLDQPCPHRESPPDSPFRQRRWHCKRCHVDDAEELLALRLRVQALEADEARLD